jgi:hypothetical protein
MRHQTLVLSLSLSLLAGVALPGEARAQAPETSEDRAAALGREGLSLFDQGRWLEANSKFQQAQKIARSPVFDLYSARALRNAGRLIEAETAFRRVVEEQLPQKAPEAFAKAKTDAKREHGQLVQRIPKLRVRPSRSIASGGEVSIDGQMVNAAVAVLVDPGKHTIIVREEGAEVARKEVEVRDGGNTLEVDIELPGAKLGEPPPPADQPKQVGPTTTSEEGSLLPGALVLGAGAASLIVGAVTGGLALSSKSDLEDSCPSGRCPESSREILDDATRLATASTATFIIGGVLAAGGVTLLILRPGGGSNDDAAKADLSLEVSPSWLGVRGRF